MPEHQRMRNWASVVRTKSPNPSKANKDLAAAIAERRERQKQIAEQYDARRKEAAAWAREQRAKLAAVERAKLEARGVTFDANGEPVLTIKQEKPDNPS